MEEIEFWKDYVKRQTPLLHQHCQALALAFAWRKISQSITAVDEEINTWVGLIRGMSERYEYSNVRVIVPFLSDTINKKVDAIPNEFPQQVLNVWTEVLWLWREIGSHVLGAPSDIMATIQKKIDDVGAIVRLLE
jgi:hypothetical protein